MLKIIDLSAEVGQFLIPIAAGSYALYQGDYSEAVLFTVCAAVQKFVVVDRLKDMYPNEIRPNGKPKSFPSGHTAGAFLGVGLLVSKYGFTTPTITAISGSILVGVSRYLTQNHWPKDVLAGASIGLIHGVVAGTVVSFLSSFKS
jgi:membrane-associated phospholipid phosphatase